MLTPIEIHWHYFPHDHSYTSEDTCTIDTQAQGAVTLTNTFKEDVKYQLSEYQKNNDIELSKAFNVKFEGNFSLKFIKIYLVFFLATTFLMSYLNALIDHCQIFQIKNSSVESE